MEEREGEMEEGTTKVDRTEERKARFRRVGARRASNVLRHIRLLRRVSNRATYKYTPGEVEQMFDTIQKQLDAARVAFEDGAADQTTFTFEED